MQCVIFLSFISYIKPTSNLICLDYISEGMKMRGSKPDSNGSQKLLSKEVSYFFSDQ